MNDEQQYRNINEDINGENFTGRNLENALSIPTHTDEKQLMSAQNSNDHLL